MDVTSPTPRVNGQLMAQCVGRRVILVGRIESAEGNTAKLKAADNVVVNVNMLGGVPQCGFLEVEGMVVSPNTLQEEKSMAFGENFDLSNYNELCKLANGAHRHMFLP